MTNYRGKEFCLFENNNPLDPPYYSVELLIKSSQGDTIGPFNSEEHAELFNLLLYVKKQNPVNPEDFFNEFIKDFS